LYKVLVKGKFGPEELVANYTPVRTDYSRNALQLINSKWEEFIKFNPKSFNGPLFRVESWSTYAHKRRVRIRLDVGDTDYKEFVGTRDPEFIKAIGREKIANPLSVGAVLITGDNKIILGRRSSTIDGSKSSISIVAGYLDPRKDLKNISKNGIKSGQVRSVDIFYGITREIFEETGVKVNHIVDLFCIGLIDNKEQKQMNLPFYARLNISSDEVISKSTTISDPEFSDIFFIGNTEQSIGKFIKSKSNKFSDLLIPTLKIYTEFITKEVTRS
jgi:8-oxo-dGTP pyrophosphatase MutT (NUDIX family)